MNEHTPYQQYIHMSKYARWNPEEGRRETWDETVDRYMAQADRQLEKKGATWPVGVRDELREGILNHDILPSMRALMTAGKALERDNVAGFNCSYAAINTPRIFSEILYILCCGTGVGYSVEEHEVAKLPVVPEEFTYSEDPIVVRDSKIGWAEAFQELIDSLYNGVVRPWDTHLVRPAGSPLKTFGGRASGPEPLERLFECAVKVFEKARGRRLQTIEAHGIVCMVGDIVVVGGVRRSALIALFTPTDPLMLHAKDGEWYEDPERAHFRLANNSAAWTSKPSRRHFGVKWNVLSGSGSGEPGIFNRDAAQRKSMVIGREPREFGTNPCGEILLRDKQFCNLSEVVIRPEDTDHDMARKVRLATILGTIQATFTDFRYLSDQWKQNCDEEALLGVSLDGVQDNERTSVKADPDKLRMRLRRLRRIYQQTNKEWAALLGINAAAAGTCAKPSGNSSQKVDCSSGMHARWGKHIIRRTRGSKTDPVSQVLYMAGVPTEDDIFAPDTTFVFSWPQKAPEGAITRKDMDALTQLEHWLIYVEEWCEHNPSVTIYVKPEEWKPVGDWVYDRFDRIIGCTFLPTDDHTYQQAPYEDITLEQYEALVAEMPTSIDWSLLAIYETSDQTTTAKELACVSGSCEV